MGSMRNWLHPENTPQKPEKAERVAVVHCKAGKGRSGTIATGYLISQEGWSKDDALQRFTERRMRVGFGNGVSIPSQLRYVGYIDRWAKEFSKEYVEGPVEVLEVHIWGLKDGVKASVKGFVDEGKKIKCFHMFHRSERTIVGEGNGSSQTGGSNESGKENHTPLGKSKPTAATWSPAQSDTSSTSLSAAATTPPSASKRRTTFPSNRNLSAIIFRPHKPILIPGSDVNIDFERRSKATYTGFAMVTSVAHVWFNAYFEGGHEHDSGVFETEWEAMDGIKGSAKKGIRAFERLKVVWRYARTSPEGEITRETRPSRGRQVSQPKPGEPVHESVPADWRGQSEEMDENRVPGVTAEYQHDRSIPEDGSEEMTTGEPSHAGSAVEGLEKSLGLRKQTVESKDVSLAGSEDEMRSGTGTDNEGQMSKADAVQKDENGDFEGVRSYFGRNGNGIEKRK